LIGPRHPQALADAIVHTIAQPERAASMAERARLAVRERFDSARLVQGIEDMYRQTLIEKRGGAGVVPSPTDGSSPTVR
jgi:hypothetical protein